MLKLKEKRKDRIATLRKVKNFQLPLRLGIIRRYLLPNFPGQDVQRLENLIGNFQKECAPFLKPAVVYFTWSKTDIPAVFYPSIIDLYQKKGWLALTPFFLSLGPDIGSILERGYSPAEDLSPHLVKIFTAEYLARMSNFLLRLLREDTDEGEPNFFGGLQAEIDKERWKVLSEILQPRRIGISFQSGFLKPDLARWGLIHRFTK